MDESKKIKLLSNILRASHFEWRRAALKTNPGQDPMELVQQFWTEVAIDTAKFYSRNIDPKGDVARQFADLFVGSSQAMDEDCTYTGTDEAGCHTVTHTDCPWYHWHKKEGLLAEDRPGCDRWLEKTAAEVNAALGTRIRFATDETIPDGGAVCRRRFWIEG
jgi:hypothetical protein